MYIHVLKIANVYRKRRNISMFCLFKSLAIITFDVLLHYHMKFIGHFCFVISLSEITSVADPEGTAAGALLNFHLEYFLNI